MRFSATTVVAPAAWRTASSDARGRRAGLGDGPCDGAGPGGRPGRGRTALELVVLVDGEHLFLLDDDTPVHDHRLAAVGVDREDLDGDTDPGPGSTDQHQ